MSDILTPRAVHAPAITVDDLRRKAVHIKDMTEVEVRQLTDERMTQIVLVGAVALLAAVSIAYYLGTRRR